MKINRFAIPTLVIIALFGGFFLRSAFTQPSTTADLGSAGGASVECIVDGVKCKGTAALFTSHLRGVPGISTIETYASDHRVVMTYDPSIISAEEIRRKIDAPVAIDDSTHVAFFRCVSIDPIDTPEL